MSIEAMKQALEALEDVQEMMNTSQWFNDRVTALRQAIEQAEKQEPVMWMDAHDFKRLYTDGTIDCNTKPHQENPEDVPLYTAPPQVEWVGLTDAEVLKLHNGVTKAGLDVMLFARMIEAKLREKNT